MRIMLVGDRAREHMLAEQLARSCELYAAMQHRNNGIRKACQKFFICDFSNVEAIGSWAIREKIDLALVTSETALAKGLADALSDIGIAIASPLSAGSLIGENTAYARAMMKAADIRAPRYMICKDEEEVKNAVREFPKMLIKPAVKVDWKGTRFADVDIKKKNEMMRHCKKMIKQHGSVIIEEMIDGESFSLQGMTDGKMLSVMPPVHISKRLLEGNEGELTEGMGGYSDGKLLPFLSPKDLNDARDCLWRLVFALNSRGAKFKGPIRGEFMAAKDGLIMLDAYPTLGGITTLNNMLLLKTQLSEVLTSIVDGSLKPLSFLEKPTVVKFLVGKGYPLKAKKSAIGIDPRSLWDNGAKAYFESVEERKGGLYSGKNRAIAICASGDTIDEAESKCEDASNSVKGDLYHRADIATSAHITRQIKHLALLRRE